MEELGTEEETLIARPYQTQLEEIAIKKNTIIHLPTGSGKTFIAVRLINRLRKDLKKPWGEGGKRTFFLVNTVPLVSQQKRVIKYRCAVKNVAGYSGEDGVDYWDKTKWNLELAQHQVIVMTSQILADMLTHAYIRIEDINLLIFDECHHAVVDHPMRLIMKHFAGIPTEKQPRILGLTATLLNGNVTVHKVESTLRELETTFHATIATVDELGEVLNYSTNPNEIIQVYSTTAPTEAAKQAQKILLDLANLVSCIKLPKPSLDMDIRLEKWQRDISSDPQKIVKEVRNMISSMHMYITEFGVYGGALGILAYIILLERLKRKFLTAEEEKLYQITITHSLVARKVLLDAMHETGYNKIVQNSSKKIIMLLDVLKEYNPTYFENRNVKLKINIARKSLSGIIFAKQRFTAKILYNLLKDVVETNPKEFGFLKHNFLVGFNVNPLKCTREQHYIKKASKTALLEFSNKELNCLISTSVIEEGVDIPQCLLVLRYDAPAEYRSYIQSKGRARSSDSSYVIFVEDSDKDSFMNKYKSFQQTEKCIQRILVGNTDYRNAPSAEDIERNLYNEDEIPPYVTNHGTRLSAVQAISLLNRYCSVLPHDQFTTITPMWIEEEHTAKIQVKIFMPVACPIKDVIPGDLMSNTKDAKRSAALNACIRLHQEGELDEITMLPRVYGSVDFDEPDVKACFLNWPWDGEDTSSYKPGTKKSVRRHQKVFPTFLEDRSSGDDGKLFYLHIIKLKTCFKRPEDSRERAIYDLLQSDEGYGFLTAKPLPKICDFSMFLTVGEVTTSVVMNEAKIKLNEQLLDLVKSYHYFLFDQILDLAKKFIVFDGKSNCMYMVPVKGNTDYNIDWAIMQTFTEIRPVAEPTFEERKHLKVRPEDYLHHVVTPWYRGTILPARYIVTKVVEYLSPSSHLEGKSENIGTFADYYSNKYNLEIYGDKNQPLLEVRNITTRMNCLLPRAATIATLTDKQLKMISLAQGDDKPKAFPELFIPEFCIKYDYPGVLWLKASMLPSIIHRITMLLVAYELRAEIAVATKIGVTHLRKEEEWMPIQLNKQVTLSSLLSMVEEPTVINNIDRINNPIDEDAPRPKNVVSMKESLYQLQKKKISQEYDWDEKMEPIDIERNISNVTLMDIECYDEFVNCIMKPTPDTSLRSPLRSPASPPVNAAILPAPIKKVSNVAVIGKKLSVRGPELKDILAALTTINSHDTFNLERVETLGDSFLKFASSLYLYHKFPKLNEGQLTNIKGRFIGNRNLFYAGQKVRLGGRMKSEQFSPKKDFLVPGFFAPQVLQDFIDKNKVRPTCLLGLQFSREEVLSGELCDESLSVIRQRFNPDNDDFEREPETGVQVPMQCYVRSQAVSDKTVADCVEALIGTYLLSDGIIGAVKVLEWFKIMPPLDDFASLLTKDVSTILKQKKTTEDDINRVMDYSREDIEDILQYKFKDPSFLLEAMSHSSYIRNRLTRSYERLEFLGDAILDFLITAHIFENSTDLKPGELTDLRSALVNNVTFASYVVKLGLHKHICYQLNPMLESAIIAFTEHQERRNHDIMEDVLYLIDEEDCQIAEYVEVPKVLSDVFESLAGAIYLDSGGDLSAVWRVYYRIMAAEIDTFSKRIPQQPVRMLYEMIHACPHFSKPIVVNDELNKVMVPVTVTKNGIQHTVNGFGGNKFQAKRAAAKLALKLLSV